MMCFVVTSVALLVDIFSKGYMEHEDGIARYYVFLSILFLSRFLFVLHSCHLPRVLVGIPSAPPAGGSSVIDQFQA